MSTKQNDELREGISENLVQIMSNIKPILKLEEVAEVLAQIYEQDELNKIARDISAEPELKTIKL